jgi:hypothetical protein
MLYLTMPPREALRACASVAMARRPDCLLPSLVVRPLMDRSLVLSAIGLALDLVGAVALTLGLYRHSRYSTPGLSRGPDDVAQDAAYGTVGASFLALGFTLQALPYLGVTVDTRPGWAAAAAGATLLLAIVVGWLAYGLIYNAARRRESTWVEGNLPAVSLPPSRRVPAGRLGWRFWNHDYES